MKYLPFLTGIYSVAPGLTPMLKQDHDNDKLVFQLDDTYESYLQNKANCRKENLPKYYIEHDLHTGTIHRVNEYILHQLVKEHPAYFDVSESGKYCILINIQTGELIQWNKRSQQLIDSNYTTLFDALCSQLQEDFAICQLQDEKDWLSAIHLCAPNHWAAGDKIGNPFDHVHAPVPGMQKTFVHYFKMLQSVVYKGPFTRYAWGISTDDRLNHHPEPPAGIDALYWQGRKIDEAAQLYIRTERQNLIGFPEVNAFLFTIRTYFYEVDQLESHEKKALWSAVRSMSPESLAYKGLTDVTDFLSRKLFREE